MNKYNDPEPVSIYSVQDHSQGMVLPTVDRSSHLSEFRHCNFPQVCKETHFSGKSIFCQFDSEHNHHTGGLGTKSFSEYIGAIKHIKMR